MARSRESLTAAYAEGVHRVRTRTVSLARRLWEASPSLRDQDAARLRRLLIPRVQAAQIQVANLANTYVTALSAVDELPAPRVAVDRDAVVGYRGVSFDEVYARPAVEVYTSLSKGNDFQTAKASGLNRLLSIVTTDIQQSRNRQSNAAYDGSGYEYTIRTLTGRENCALCVIASTQRYHKRNRELLPIHPGCDCGEEGVKAGRDPGQVIRPELLELTHSTIETKFGATDRGARFLSSNPNPNDISDYLDLVVTNEHGELGPTLGWRGEHFTGPADIH